MATARATSRTSTFSRQAALGLGLSHLLAAFSRFSISFSNAGLSACSATACWLLEIADWMASTACGEGMARWWLRSFWTCLRMAVAWRTVLDKNQRRKAGVEERGASGDAGAGADGWLPGGLDTRFAALAILCFQYFNKRFLRDIHGAEGLHAFLAFLLLFQELALAGDVAAVTLGGHVFAQRADGFAGDDFAADGGLNGDRVLLARDDFL